MENSKRPVLFGCDFDPNPDIDGLRRKLWRFVGASGSLVGESPRVGESPYDLIVKNIKISQGETACRLAGKYPCPGWLSATPDFDREIYPEMYRQFIDDGGCLRYARGLGRFIAAGYGEGEIPVTIAVDHCLSGGIIEALTQKYGELTVIIFDAHLDAISPPVRNGLVGFRRDQESKDNNLALSYEYYGETFAGNYDTGSFLNHLLKENVLQGDRLLVFGTQDPPSPRLSGIKDQRVLAYIREYEWLEQQGVVIKPLKNLGQVNAKKDMPELQGKLAGQNVYLSIDVDVLKGKIGMAARYGSENGLTISKLFKVLAWLGLAEANVIGMDIMELDVNSLPFSGLKEADFCSFVKNMLSAICNQSSWGR